MRSNEIREHSELIEGRHVAEGFLIVRFWAGDPVSSKAGKRAERLARRLRKVTDKITSRLGDCACWVEGATKDVSLEGTP